QLPAPAARRRCAFAVGGLPGGAAPGPDPERGDPDHHGAAGGGGDRERAPLGARREARPGRLPAHGRRDRRAMKGRVAIPFLVVIAASMWLWRAELFNVARPGERPRALEARPRARRPPAAVDVVLPEVPAGMRRVRAGDQVLLIHYWAPSERDSRAQAQALD